jgi:hypothetical protein
VLGSIRAQLLRGGLKQMEEVPKLERVCVRHALGVAWHSVLRHSPLPARWYLSPLPSSRRFYLKAFSMTSTAIVGAKA